MAGVRRVTFVFVVLAVAATVPYLAPGLERLQVWQPGRSVPFTRFVDFRPMAEGPRIAGVDGLGRLEGDLGADDDALLLAAPLPAPPTLAPLVPLAPLEAETDAVSAAEVAPRFTIDASEWEGMTREVEDPGGAMGHFYDRLAAAGLGEPGAIARVTMYSDSINASDRVTSVLRHSLQARFGDGGKGWVPIAPGWQSHRHRDVEWSDAGGWRVRVLNRGGVEGGRYGLGGVLAENRSTLSRASYETTPGGGPGAAVSRFDLYYQSWPGGGALDVSVDHTEARRFSSASSVPEDRILSFPVTDGRHSLEVAVGEGAVRLYGVVMEREGPGVVVDGLALVGAFTKVLLHFDEAHWKRQFGARGSDLMVFWLGGNDAVSEAIPFSPERYRRDYTEILRRARAGRSDASCLVMSVLDAAELVDGAIVSRRGVPRVVAAQRAVAEASGCAFFDAHGAIGGSGTMARWYRSSPRLVSVDYRHLTMEGSRVVASLLNKALLRGLAMHLAAPPVSGVVAQDRH